MKKSLNELNDGMPNWEKRVRWLEDGIAGYFKEPFDQNNKAHTRMRNATIEATQVATKTAFQKMWDRPSSDDLGELLNKEE